MLAVSLTAGFLATSSLLLPWFVVGGKSRSSIDLLASANALEVLTGPTKVAVVGAWLLVPVVQAIAMVVGASGRRRASALCVVPVAVATLIAVAAGAVSGVVSLAWGAGVGAVFAAVALLCAIMVLMKRRATA